jgi:Dolichyl-phosphate-mannose-protein mannosyltransferase
VVFVVAVVLRAIAALALPTPFLLPDEGAYALLGRGLWHHADLAVLGGPSQYASALYPVLTGLPPAVLRVIQVIAMCGAAIVVYVWVREMVRPAWALAGAALTLALPALAYSGTIVAEAIFLPLATLASWFGVRALVSPSRRNQLVLVAALAACGLTRGEANMFVLALLAGAAVTRRLRALWPTWAACAAFCVAWLALGGLSPLRALGETEAGNYALHHVVVSVLELGGELVLVCGALPLCAAILLASTRPRDLEVRATTTFALALAGVAVLEVGIFAAGHADHLLEREVIFVLPPLFVAFTVWLGLGAPRPRLRTAAVAVAAVAVLLAMPFGRLARGDAAPDNPTLVPLTHLDSPHVYGVVALFALAAGIALLALPRRFVWLLPVGLGAVLVATSVSAAKEFVNRSRAARLAYTAPDTHWIDSRTDAPVTYLYDGADDFRAVWSQLYWNKRIDHVLDLPATHVPGPLPQAQLQLVGGDGALELVGGGVPETTTIVAPQGFHFRGRRISHAPRVGLSIWRVSAPPRLRTWTQGVQRNGDVLQGGVATLEVFDCGRGTFHLIAIGRDNESVQLSQNGNPVATKTLWPDGVWEQTIDTPASGVGGQCSFSLSTTSLVHLATFDWRPR